MPRKPAQEQRGLAALVGLFDGPRGRMSVVVARHINKIHFSAADRSRMHELACRNQEGDLTREELEEFDEYVNAADLLSIYHLRARLRLGMKLNPREWK